MKIFWDLPFWGVPNIHGPILHSSTEHFGDSHSIGVPEVRSLNGATTPSPITCLTRQTRRTRRLPRRIYSWISELSEYIQMAPCRRIYSMVDELLVLTSQLDHDQRGDQGRRPVRQVRRPGPRPWSPSSATCRTAPPTCSSSPATWKIQWRGSVRRISAIMARMNIDSCRGWAGDLIN